jgi:predicted dehydrogenase/threonine dehydrogenase-like Zn-dependent dehydrogenase
MKQVLQHVRSRRLEVAEVPAPGCRPGGILVRNTASLLSAGTERMVTEFASKSMLGKARERPDLVKQVIDKVKRDGLVPTARAVVTRLDQPIALGYSCAGVVIEAGSEAAEFSVGDHVACAGMGYASHADVVFVPKNLAATIPAGVSDEDASYVTVGAIALQGLRVADVRIGDNVVVIGLGLLGQLTVQMLLANGCRVFGIDIDDDKIALVRAFGADGMARSGPVEDAVNTFTRGHGADAVIISAATTSNDPIELAGRIARDRAAVTVVGAVQMDVPRKLFYEKELQLRLSRSYGPGRYDPAYEERGQDYPIGYVRWTEKRNMQEFLRLVGIGAVTPARLTTHRFAIADAEQAYALVKGETGEAFTGVVITYRNDVDATRRTVPLPARRPAGDRVGIGFVGAGNFAQAILLPRFSARRDADLVSVATASGASAKATGAKFGFRECGTDSGALLANPRIQAVVVATRHGSHARLAAQALRAGKSVFVEKPLALNDAELQDVIAAVDESGGVLAVGFNRRFSSLATELRGAVSGTGPIAINYRVNAGPVPAHSWLHDPAEGGGRIIGEACHFIDVMQFVTDELPVEAFAVKLGGPSGATADTVSVTLRFSGGSVGSLSYVATGDKAYSKERIEAYGGGAVAVVDDWQSFETTRGGRRRKRRLLVQDKGYDGEVAAFLGAVRGSLPPISLASLVATSRATFAIVRSLEEGRPVAIASA